MDYFVVKTVHQGAVLLSISGFFARGLGSLLGAAWVQGRLAKSLPHGVDAVLLLSALWLAWMLRLTPDEAPWLLAKIIGLLVYIALGMLALKPGRPWGLRAAAWLAALATVGWMVSVAITKNPLGFFS
ncbi:SirB2 family protein [Roseateles toxinivorans]|uniref:Putative membrane protein SirB2 n=1 Tax=Roseateles toxinivorans TaxID=270368 RepID=A0A4R6QL87_9BURK|nr:SirB2 family protein [Roseateles toxinivorans]TDP71249.1 putative membrane protein SirB2 [Roseateles toxinivorans]